jgi:hypothetical protein
VDEGRIFTAGFREPDTNIAPLCLLDERIASCLSGVSSHQASSYLACRLLPVATPPLSVQVEVKSRTALSPAWTDTGNAERLSMWL